MGFLLFVTLLGVIAALLMLLRVLAVLQAPRSERDVAAELMLDAFRTAGELRRDAWATRQAMRRALGDSER